MTNYRDYVSLGYLDSNQGPRAGATINVPIEQPTTQVFKATHDEAGNRLSRMNRAFISFTYGGKYIEDFGFIATISNNAMNGNIYADFSDQVTESEVFDGQIYWSSHYNANSISFELATDGITENEFDNFKQWFVPGVIRELVLMERPNRGILARVAEVPTYSMLPFGHETTVKLAEKEYTTKTTMYKGSISLKLVMDDPFWYSLTNFLCYEETPDERGPDTYNDPAITKSDITYFIPSMTTDANGNKVAIVEDKDALKMILEDGIPIADTLFEKGWDSKQGNELANVNRILIGDNNFAFCTSNNGVVDGPEGSYVDNSSAIEDAVIGANVQFGHVAYSLEKKDEQVGVDVLASTSELWNGINFYYGGNAPCYPKIKFSIRPQIYYHSTSNWNYYMVRPFNDLYSKVNSNVAPYNIIRIKAVTDDEDKILKFTVPSLWYGYNQVIEILKEFNGNNKNDVIELIRERVKHYIPRNYAINILNQQNDFSINNCLSAMPGLFIDSDVTLINNKPCCYLSEFEIDNKNGRVIAHLPYNDGNTKKILDEDVSDMIKSNYLYIDKKNILNPDGYIQSWSSPYREYNYGYRLIHNYSNSGEDSQHNLTYPYDPLKLENFSMTYKFMYR